MQRIVIDFVTRTWFIAAVTVVICAFFIAKAAGSIIEAEALTDAPKSTVPIVVQPKPIVAERPKLDGTKIARNIFCSSCEPAPLPGLDGEYTGEPAVLIATMMGPDPRATVRVLASEAQGSWGLGERIPGVGTIDQIRSTSIDVVDVAGHRGTISLLETTAVGPPKKSGPASLVPVAAADPFADRVRKIAENDYEVDRALVRELVTSGAKPGQPRIMPRMKGGEISGLGLSGVRPGSVAAAIGLKNADVIVAIDGDPIKNVQQLIDLYAKLDQMSAVEITGTRGGKPLAITLRLR